MSYMNHDQLVIALHPRPGGWTLALSGELDSGHRADAQP